MSEVYFISKRLWEYDPLFYSAQKYWLDYHLIERYLCKICYDMIPFNNISYNCNITNDKYCKECFKLYLINKINDSQVLSNNQIKCPCSDNNCNNNIQNNQIIEILNNHQDIITKFHQFSLNVEVALDNKRVFCPNQQCGKVVTIESKWSKNVTCKSCKLNFCTLCKETHNSLISCSRSGDIQFNKWRKQTTQGCKRCPNCHIYIEKNEGCNHMTCYKCRHEFCWECLSWWNGSCSAPKVYHNSIKLLNDDIWGQSVSTRVMRKSIGIPLLFTVGCGVGSVVVGVAACAAGVAVSGLIIGSPVAAGVYVYKHPPKAIRNLQKRYFNKSSPITRDDYFLIQQGIKIALPWQYDDPNYLQVLSGEKLIVNQPPLEIFVENHRRNQLRNQNQLIYNNNQNQNRNNNDPKFMGISGRRCGSIFIGYMNPPTSSPIPPFLAYFIPSSCPQEDLDQLNTPFLNEMMTVAFPSNTVPYSYLRSEDEWILPEIYNRIETTLLNNSLLLL